MEAGVSITGAIRALKAIQRGIRTEY